MYWNIQLGKLAAGTIIGNIDSVLIERRFLNIEVVPALTPRQPFRPQVNVRLKAAESRAVRRTRCV